MAPSHTPLNGFTYNLQSLCVISPTLGMARATSVHSWLSFQNRPAHGLSGPINGPQLNLVQDRSSAGLFPCWHGFRVVYERRFSGTGQGGVALNPMLWSHT